MGTFIDITGNKYNMLTVVSKAGKDKYGKILWTCECECGSQTISLGRNLVSGRKKSCGCLKNKEKIKNAKFKGYANSRIYNIWRGMIDRCYNKNNQSYHYYGERGISVCEEWIGVNGFFSFLYWSNSNGYSKNLTIDRIDNDKNYCPDNCRWADWKTQANNRRKPDSVKNQYGEWKYRIPLPQPHTKNRKES